MNKDEIYDFLKSSIVNDFEKNESLIALDKGLADIGMDSLDAFDFFTMINEKFGIDLDQREITELKTVGDVVEYIHSKSVS